MPTFNQLVRKGREQVTYKSTSPALQYGLNTLKTKTTDLPSPQIRPMHHGGKHKGQGVGAQAQALAVLHHHAALLGNGIRPKELIHIQESFGVAHHLHFRVEGGQSGDVGTVVRLHVADHQIIRLASGQCLGQVGKPGLRGTVVHRIQNGGLFVQNDIGIVAHAGGHRVLALEQV